MTVKKQLEAIIDAASYEACWRDTNPPHFNEFMKFAVTAFENTLPGDATNLRITIHSSTDGRINTVGSFRRGDEDYEVFGQIVWVSRHCYFRGKPGFRKMQDPVIAPTDKSDTFRLVPDTSIDLNGFGAMLMVSPRSLVAAFGQPGKADEFKVSGMYIFEGNAGSAFRINDYEETTLYWGEERRDQFPTPDVHWHSDQICEFRVAGNANPDVFIQWVKARIAGAS